MEIKNKIKDLHARHIRPRVLHGARIIHKFKFHALIGLAIITGFLLALSNPAFSFSNGQNATDVIGQRNGPDPAWTTTTNSIYNRGFSNPQGLAIDTVDHRLFVADNSNNRVLVFNLNSSNQLVDRQADNILGQASFATVTAGSCTNANGLGSPYSLAYDSTNKRLYVGNGGYNRIQIFDTTTITNGEASVSYLGTTDCTGTGQNAVFWLGGLALNNDFSKLFVSNGVGGERIMVFNVGDGITNGENAINVLGQPDYTTLTSSCAINKLNNPSSLAYLYNSSGEDMLFVSDQNNQRIMIFGVEAITNGENAINVLGQSVFTSCTATQGQAGFNYTNGLALNTAGTSLYVSDAGDSRIKEYNIGDGITNGENAVNLIGQTTWTTYTGATTQSGLNVPYGIAYNTSTSELYISDNTNNRVMVFDSTELAKSYSTIKYASNMLGQTTNGSIPVYTKGTANDATQGDGFSSPASVAIDTTDDRLFVSDNSKNRVLVYNLNTDHSLADYYPDSVLGQPDFTTTTGTTTQSGMKNPYGLTYDAARKYLFVADTTNNRVLVFDVTSITDGENAINILGYTTYGDSTLYAPPYAWSLNTPYGLAYDSTRNYLFVTESAGNWGHIRVFDVSSITNGENSIKELGQAYLGGGGIQCTSTGQNYLSDIAYDQARNYLFASDNGYHRIMVYDLNAITDGEAAINVLGQSTFTSCPTQSASSSTLYGPRGLAYDSARNYLYASDGGNSRILVYDVAAITDGEAAINVFGQSSFTSSATTTTQTGLYWPRGVAYDATTKRLYISDALNSRVIVQSITTPPAVTVFAPNGSTNVSGNSKTAYTAETADSWVRTGGLPSSLTWQSITSSSDGTKLAAVVNNGAIYTSTDAGVNWTIRNSNGLPTTGYWMSITSSSDGTKLAAVQSTGAIYTSTDSGVNWTIRNSNGLPASASWYSITSSSDGTKLAAVVYGGAIYTSTDSGVNWTIRNSNGLPATANWWDITSSVDGANLAAVVYGGAIYTSTDSGVNWTIRNSNGLPATANWQNIASSDDGTKLAAVVYQGAIYTSTDSGVNWTIRNSNGLPATAYWRNITSSSDGAKLTAGAGYGAIYTSTDSGVNWTIRNSNGLPASAYWYGITSSSDGTKLTAVAWYGAIYTSTDSGVNWTLRNSNGLLTIASWYGITSSSDGTKLVTGGYLTALHTSTDSGVNWTIRNSNGLPATASWTSMTSSDDGTKLAAVASYATIYTSTDTGVNWTARGTGNGLPSSAQWQSITSSGDGTKLAAAATSGAIYTSTDSGVNWTIRNSNGLPATASWQSITSSNDGTKLAAVVFGGAIYTSTDSGVNWTIRNSNGLPTTANWRDITSSDDGIKLAAAATSGAIYTSTDSGVNWTIRNSNGLPATASWYGITSSGDGTKLAAVAMSGAMYTSTDSGVNWTIRNTGGLPATANWRDITSSGDGTKLAAVAAPGSIYSSTNYLLSNSCSIDNSNWAACSSEVTLFSSIPGYAALPRSSFTLYVKSTNPDNETGTGQLSLTKYSTPTSISPAGGLPAGGGNATISGTDFISGNIVSIGGTPCTSTTFISSTSLTCVGIPAGTTGTTVDVTVLDNGVTITLAAAYTYRNAPTVTVIAPIYGPSAGGQSVTITGTDFYGTPTVTINGATATNVVVVGLTTITATTTTGTAGLGNVVVTTSSGAGTLTNGYTYWNAPTVTAVNPVGGLPTGTQSVTITGTNFYGTPTVTFGGTSATAISVTNSTTITATRPAHAAGLVDVVVTTLSGAGTKTGGYTYADAPTVTAITPVAGPSAGGQSVTITGTNFYGTPTVTFSGTSATAITVTNSTTITATTPAMTAGAKNVVVTTPSGSGTKTSAYTYYSVPTVTAIAPTGGPLAGGQSVTITGTNFYGTPTVTINGATASNVVVVGTTSITATTPANTAGLGNVVVTTLSGAGTKTNGYTYYDAPTVTSVNPGRGSITGLQNITITGTNFYGTPTVTFGGTSATSIAVSNSTTITATTPAGTAGLADVVVTTLSGTNTLTGGFQYVVFAAPTVTLTNPNKGSIGGSQTVSITGTNFYAPASATFDGLPATNVTVISETEVYATTPAHAAGPVDVTVTTLTDTGTLTDGYSYTTLFADGQPAIDVIGQRSGSLPSWTTNGKINNRGLYWPQAIAFDTIDHRMFVTDGNDNRVLIYNLNSSNQLIDNQADFVLGQAGFATSTAGACTNASGLSNPKALAYDSTNKKLYVGNGGYDRIQIFDVTSITNGEASVNYLGTTNCTGTTQNSVNSLGFSSLVLNNDFSKLFVSNTTGALRILVFNVGDGITDGENAINVLGQPDYATITSGCAINKFALPHGLAYLYNPAGEDLLFVADASNFRILVFGVDAITDGEDAINVLGQSGFATCTSIKGQTGFNYPYGVTLNTANTSLFVADYSDNRVMEFNIGNGITDNEPAVNLIGQTSYTGYTAATTQSGLNTPAGLAYNSSTSELYIADRGNHRVMAFNSTELAKTYDTVKNAGNVMGQTSDGVIPLYTKGTTNDSPNVDYFYRPNSMVVDTTDNRLFVADQNNNRVLVFNLNADHTPVDYYADFVLGQPNFYANSTATTQAGMWFPFWLTYDSTGKRLFVSDGANYRVLVFDVATITNGEAAINVLGQSGFSTRTIANPPTSSSLNYPKGLHYKAADNKLFVADEYNNRILVYDVASITDGEAAINVLGQSDFVTNTAANPPTSGSLNYPYGITYDSARNYLFASDSNNNRILVYDLSTITDGEAAINVLGQSDFVTKTAAAPPTSGSLNLPFGLIYDSARNYLFASDDLNNRILVYNLATVSDGEPAINVLGQSLFTSNTSAVSQTGLYGTEGLEFDPTTKRLYIADFSNYRVIVHSTSSPTVTVITPAIGGSAGGGNAEITGTDFSSLGAKVSIGGTDCSSTTYNSSTSLTCVGIPAGTLGTADVTVINGDGVTVTYAAGYTYSDKPDPPSGLSLYAPATSPNTDTTPTITVSGMVSGDTAALFSDDTCTTQIGSAVASGTTVNVTASPALSDGLYTFFANSTNPADSASDCSTAHVSYLLDTTTPDINPLDAGASSTDRTSLTSGTWFKNSAIGGDGLMSYGWTDPASASKNYFYYTENASASVSLAESGLLGWWPLERKGTFYDAKDGNAATKIPGTAIESDSGRTVFSHTVNYNVLETSDFIPIDTAKSYVLSGDFKSAGTTNSAMYYGFAPYDEYHQNIGSERVLRQGNDLTISSFTDTQINVAQTISGWNSTGTVDYSRTIGFYYDGDTTKLPNYVWYTTIYADTDPAHGAYSTASGTTIALNAVIPPAVAANIIPGTTVIKNHNFSSSYMYSTIMGATVPASWTNYSGTITGEDWGVNPNIFWKGTKYVKILFLTNYNAGSSKILFDDISLKETDDNSVIDFSASGNTGTLQNGTTFTDGKLGQSGSFDGTDDYVSTTTAGTPSSYTYSMWLNPQSSASRRLFFHRGSAGSECHQYAEVNSDGTISNFHGTNPYTFLTTNGTTANGSWTHYAVTWDGTTMTAYINGALDSGTQNGSAAFVSGGETLIGKSCGYYYKGAMDEVKVYDRALTATEIANEYNKRMSVAPFLDSYAATEGNRYFHVKPLSGVLTWGTERIFNVMYDATAPSAPSGLSLNSPTTSPNTVTTPSITVSGVVSGDTVKLFSDSGCTTQKGSETAAGTTVNITSSTLSDGSYTFYANSTDPIGNISDCSTANVGYLLDTTAPSTPSLTYTDGYNTTGSQNISFSATDAESNISSYTVYYKSGTLSAGSCSSWDADWTSLGTKTSGYAQSMTNNKCYKYYVLATNGVGLTAYSTQSPTAVTKVSTTAPSVTGCAVVEGTNPGKQYQTGTTLYYNSGYTGDFTVNVTAEDTVSGIQKVNFPTLASGFTPTSTDDTTPAYTQTYSWTTAATAEPGAKSATITSYSGLTNTCGFTVTKDVTAPDGTITYSTQYITSVSTDPAMTIGNLTETGSGEDTSTRTLQRATATLSNNSCGTYGGFATTTQGGTYPNVTDTGTITDATCYKYQWLTTDYVGNTGTFTTSNEYKVDTTEPATTVSGVTESSADIYFATGSKTVFYKTPGSSQNFTVTADASDTQSGIEKVRFPGINVTGFTPTTYTDDATSTYSNQYAIGTSATTSPGAATVTGYNNAGLTKTDDFTVTADLAAPTGSSVSCPSSYDTDGNYNVTGGSGSDSVSGVDTANVYFQRRDGTLSANSCGSYGSFTNIGSANATNLGQTSLATGCYEYQYYTVDLTGNSTTSSTCTVKVDTSNPSVSVSGVTESSNYIYYNSGATTLYYNNAPATPGSFTVDVTASDTDSGIADVSGSTEFGDAPTDMSSPYNLAYSIEQSSTCTTPITVTATNNAGGNNAANVTCTLDTTAPATGSITYSSQYITSTATKAALTVADGTDGGSGLATSTRTLQRASATFADGACGTYGSYSNTTYSGTYPDIEDAGTMSGVTCYKYKWLVSDNVGNQATYNGGNEVIYIGTPTVTDVTPPAGSIAGNNSVTITGTNFFGTPAVTFDTGPATNVVVVSDTEITATTPAHAAGLVDITVETAADSGSMTDAYTYYAAPTVTAIDPIVGPATGSQSVTITGTNFYGSPTVNFGSTPATNVSVTNTTTITATTPSHAAGTVSVSVVTLTDTGTKTSAYTYHSAPVITTVSPDNGPLTEGTSITITGSNFTGITAVTFGGTAATSFNVDNTTQITAIAPAHTAGAVDVVVTNPGGTATKTGGYTYLPPPTVTTVSPATGSTVGGDSITITGTNFANVTSVKFGTIPATFIVDTPTQITATAPPHLAGLVDLTVTTTMGTYTKTGAYTFVVPPSFKYEFYTAAAGSNFTIALRSDGTVSTWGLNNHGQLGNNSTTESHSAVTVSGLTGITSVAAGNDYALALKDNGTVWAWGANTYGQLGDNSTTESLTPVQVTGLTNIAAIFTGHGSHHSFAIKNDGTVYAWGLNDHGQLGDNTTDNQDAPIQITALSNISSIATGAGHTLGLKNDGTVLAWGYNNYGQVGDGGNSESHVPAQVLTTGISISAGPNHSLAVKSNGTVWAWGYNNHGQLGINSTTDSNTPVQISTFTGVSQVSAGLAHSLALKSNGTVWAWGANESGQLGDSSFTERLTPVQVTGLTNELKVMAGTDHSIAIGSLLIWGDNDNGELGVCDTGGVWAPIDGGLSCTPPIAPNRGPIAGGTDVTLTGSGFVDGANVQFDGVDSTDIIFDSETQIRATTPPHAAGIVDVTVINPDDETATLTNGFRFDPPPTVTGLDPAAGTIDGGTTVTITGTGFIDGADITFDGTSCDNITFVSETSLTCDTLSHAQGAFDVIVTNPDAQSDATPHQQFTYFGAISATTSTFTAIPAEALPDGVDEITLTITIKDAGNNVIPGVIVEMNATGPGTLTYDPATRRQTTNSSGVAVLTVTSTDMGSYNLTATAAPDVTAIDLTQHRDVTFQCAVGSGEQCVGLNIGSAGALTMEVPADFSFGNISSPANAYSKDDANYTLNINDLVTVSDMRGSAGFNLQLQASAGGFSDGLGNYLPLQGFYAVTTAADTGGTAIDGVEYAGTDTTPEDIVAYQDANIDPTLGGLQQSATFTTCGSALGSGSTVTTPGTATPIDLMIGGVSGAGGRIGTFKQNINYHLAVPTAQPQGDYTTVLTFTLIDSTDAAPTQPSDCNP